MGYDSARSKMSEYRDKKTAALMGESRRSWFAELWGGISDMLKTFDSSEENGEIAGSYAKAPSLSKITAHVKLDYVCGLRREIRKQYVSEESGVYTDVTPFRHGLISIAGDRLFDNTLEMVMKKSSQRGNVA